jgi:hypothetical protein
MKYTAVLAAGLVAVASAQDFADLPACSLQCIMDAVQDSDCPPTDLGCICGSIADLMEAAVDCVIDACGVDVAQGMSTTCDSQKSLNHR